MARSNSWSKAETEFLMRAVGKMTYTDIAEAIGRTEKAVRSRAKVLKLTRSRLYTESELATVRELYPTTPTVEIAAKLGRTRMSIYQMADKLGLKKDPEYMREQLTDLGKRLAASDNGHRFRKGESSWNKGTKGICGTHPNCKATQFKKGERQGVAVKLYQPIGTERISKDGYLERKINDDLPLQRRWRAVHRIVWEEANGPIPRGHAVVFRDRNKQNLSLDNLELVTRQDLMRRNTLHNLPEPIRAAIHIVAGFNRKLNKYAKEQTDRP